MTTFIDAVGHWVINHQTLRHLFVAGGIILQGELTAFISVTLVLKKYLSWDGFLLSALAGIVLYDSFLFSIGKFFKNKPLGRKWEEKIMKSERMQLYLRHYMSHFLVVARFLIYVNVGAVVLAGLTDMKLKEFLKNRVFADALWLAVLTGGSYLILSGLTLLNLRQVEVGIAIFIILVFVANALFRRFLRTH